MTNTEYLKVNVGDYVSLRRSKWVLAEEYGEVVYKNGPEVCIKFLVWHNAGHAFTMKGFEYQKHHIEENLYVANYVALKDKRQ